MDRESSETLPGLPDRADDGGDPALTRLAARAYRSATVDIEEALRRDWIEVWYQPQLDFRQGQLTGAEALARIRHPELGVLLPQPYLATASEASLARLTESALRMVLSDWSQFDAEGFDLQLSVNVPASVLFELPLSELVSGSRPAAEHWPGLTIEVKQNQIVRELERMLTLAIDLQPHGVHIAIDNFNGSYVSFSQLRELPFSRVKLHHGYVRDCAGNPAHAAVCRAGVEFARRFGLVSVADGIETHADLLMLQQIGCDGGQGVLIAPPLPPPGLIDLLQHWQRHAKEPAASDDIAAAERDRHLGINRVA